MSYVAKRRISLWIAALMIALCGMSRASLAAEDAQLRVLFLGDQGHHEPQKRFAWISAPLAAVGIAATYTENLADLNSATLAQYDAVMVYANIKSISADQERAVTDYVNNGHGFVPIHCASACFGNSKQMVALIGARFKTHKVGVFSPVILNPQHPVMAGFKGYEFWDETYVHSDHNLEGRTVLAERVEGDVHEPWTWVREQGKGRVFYTASGHDERAWTNPAFQELIARGTAWAAGAKGAAVLARLVAHPMTASVVAKVEEEAPVVPGKKVPLKYEPRPTVQNYEKRTPYPQYQLPLSAADSQAYTKVEPEFELKFFAGEPDIVKPIAFTFDPRGRLYVLQSVDYPSTFTEQWQGHDRIIICEDTKGTGRADKFTVFAEGLNIATGLTFVNGGVVVSQAPNLLFLKDTNGDDKADVREIVMTGWSKRDTHAGPSNLRYGFDNKIYGSVGYSGFAGEVGGVKQEFRMGLWRMNRTFDRLEFLAQFSNNTWGLGFNEEGELFGSTANNAHHFYAPIPLPYSAGMGAFEKDKRVSTAFKMDAHYDAHPITEHIRQVDVQGGFSSSAGQTIYTARNFPGKYWNRAALVSEPEMHLLHQGFLKRDGSGWIEDGDGRNLLASEDEWMAPVHSEVGPDGAVWVADWYNFIIQHNPTPKAQNGGFDATTGLGGAHENPLRDHERGRIYRIVWKKAKPSPITSLDMKDAAGLVRALKSDNLFWRLTAQRLLVERNQPDVIPELIALAGDQSVDELGLNVGVIHALWTLHGLSALNGSNPAASAVAVAALKHPAPGVRRNALQVLPASANTAKIVLDNRLLSDPDPNVKLAALLAISAQPSAEEIGQALNACARELVSSTDKWLPAALRVAAARHAEFFLAAELKSGIVIPTVAKGGGELERAVARHASGTLSQAVILKLLALLENADSTLSAPVLDGFALGCDERKTPFPATEEAKAIFTRLATRLDDSNKRRLGVLAEKWGLRESLPGIAGAEITKPAASTAKQLSPEQQKRFVSGKATYLTYCIACHQPDGQGLEAVAPPLAGSEWVTGSDAVLTRIVLHGVAGPITAAGKSFNLEMPAFKEALDDDAMAELLTYIRHEWGNDADPVEKPMVRQIRKTEGKREKPWTVPELKKIK